MIIGIGSDIVNIKRIDKLLSNFGKRFVSRCFSSSEQKYCDVSENRTASYAKRFASKEAFSKALGTGISNNVHWRDIVIVNLPIGKPVISLSDRVSIKLLSIIPEGYEPVIHLTITDDFPFAQAFVVIECLSKQT
ncbi:holo-ACP synthase [Candidatus Liberibacter americanus]|uniref:Holo-[acyl-carrier-protein] synthase n=1 Tax=Candidatus Liberibacter americanus str. Sao Paulo TaxID=1261131 RepID=U6B4S6_9HYPH|nr:holo-ACP synthase [Candidatus Liberibacter americanus]AHA28074.1 Holo-[acyl-carrier protein] synthase [Candidatus Liberibacter americanus str. Sao Paulo]EMS35957.1 4'-phosphopantetheinyl transferase [Candidatus Liberibacter americanus PW_SP]